MATPAIPHIFDSASVKNYGFTAWIKAPLVVRSSSVIALNLGAS